MFRAPDAWEAEDAAGAVLQCGFPRVGARSWLSAVAMCVCVCVYVCVRACVLLRMRPPRC